MNIIVNKLDIMNMKQVINMKNLVVIKFLKLVKTMKLDIIMKVLEVKTMKAMEAIVVLIINILMDGFRRSMGENGYVRRVLRKRTRNRAKRTAFYLSLLMKIIPAKDRERMLKTRYSNNL
mmetsp:Transcript_8723/g.11500  ORF Transcript_8723/g.11500 Transcript_8723/m.11500 type:complete len:120 (+) Transcript_8723:77-436(+)